MNYAQEPLQKFLDDLAARTPAPGGGGASALGGALGAAAAQMAAAFTTGQEKFKNVAAEALELQCRLEEFRHRFLLLMRADIAAYGGWAAARALPKNAPERPAAVAKAAEESTAVPEKILLLACEAQAAAEKLAGIVNPRLAGDVAVAAYFFEAAARGAGIQVLSNCANDDNNAGCARRAAALEKVAQCQAARERIDKVVQKLL
jgi:formiminotetrahydrofolate cyclodeaminase